MRFLIEFEEKKKNYLKLIFKIIYPVVQIETSNFSFVSSTPFVIHETSYNTSLKLVVDLDAGGRSHLRNLFECKFQVKITKTSLQYQESNNNLTVSDGEGQSLQEKLEPIHVQYPDCYCTALPRRH